MKIRIILQVIIINIHIYIEYFILMFECNYFLNYKSF